MYIIEHDGMYLSDLVSPKTAEHLFSDDISIAIRYHSKIMANAIAKIYNATVEEITVDKIEKMIEEKGLTGQRITNKQINDSIIKSQYHVFGDTMVTVCCLTLENGFNVIGSSACADPDNFDKKVGRTIAYDNARQEIWKLEGYLLKQRMYECPKKEVHDV